MTKISVIADRGWSTRVAPFTTPFCCYGNDVDCDRCGSWGVFATAAKLPGPWDDVLPPDRGR